ncbi:CPBP family intramembrane metalloprotease [Mameliella sp. AT18]|uniref:CPBP family glutamic-type intramembrane protease n=1 Tax=Mameliella sp. AT18 TaxID=3028385 RepID=UPI001112D41A|nr:CPBP family glutamic-type intramembrane protease [Mameliella sp. AT18]MDD9730225.1 CPBP family intramembrane metalloprotease [Mameliella sp. AT18]
MRQSLGPSALATVTAMLVVVALGLPLGFKCGIIVYDPVALPWLRYATILIAPALVEELIFRAPLLWVRRERLLSLGAVLLAGYVLQHSATAWLIWPDARAFFWDPCFLLLTAWLGLVNMVLVVATGRVMPAVIVHWLAVTGWMRFLGGEDAISRNLPFG